MSNLNQRFQELFELILRVAVSCTQTLAQTLNEVELLRPRTILASHCCLAFLCQLIQQQIYLIEVSFEIAHLLQSPFDLNRHRALNVGVYFGERRVEIASDSYEGVDALVKGRKLR